VHCPTLRRVLDDGHLGASLQTNEGLQENEIAKTYHHNQTDSWTCQVEEVHQNNKLDSSLTCPWIVSLASFGASAQVHTFVGISLANYTL
jgi:hypothetical protein